MIRLINQIPLVRIGFLKKKKRFNLWCRSHNVVKMFNMKMKLYTDIMAIFMLLQINLKRCYSFFAF